MAESVTRGPQGEEATGAVVKAPHGPKRKQNLWAQMRREEAHQQGMLLSELEAMEELSVALKESAQDVTDDNTRSVPTKNGTKETAKGIKEIADQEVDMDGKPAAAKLEEDDEDDVPEYFSEHVAHKEESNERVSDAVTAPSEDRSMIFTLSDDLVLKVVSFLAHGEEAVYVGLTSTRLTWLAREELVFAELCRQVYLAQSEKKILNVRRWKSWRNMYVQRPRLRTNGMYILKVSYIKTPVRDMWSTYIPGTILEVTYYRYFKFFNDGRVAYALMHHPPREAIELFQARSPKIVLGTYTIRKTRVTCEIPASYAHIGFTMELINGARGHFTTLQLFEHHSTARNDPLGGKCWHRVKPAEDMFHYQSF